MWRTAHAHASISNRERVRARSFTAERGHSKTLRACFESHPLLITPPSLGAWKTHLQLARTELLSGVVSEQPIPLAVVSGPCQQSYICPLNKVRAGTCVRIKQLPASAEVSHRLRELGFCEEQKIRLLSQNQSVICQVCNARLGISPQLAENIMVEPVTPQKNVA